MEAISGARLPPLMRAEEAGELLRLSKHAVYRAAAAGELPTIRIGRRLFIPTARLLALLGMTAVEGAFGATADGGTGSVQIVRGGEV